jgi:hypothetical protein
VIIPNRSPEVVGGPAPPVLGEAGRADA